MFLGAFPTGLLGLVTAVRCAFCDEYLPGSLCVIGAAIAFGLATNAVLRR